MRVQLKRISIFVCLNKAYGFRLSGQNSRAILAKKSQMSENVDKWLIYATFMEMNSQKPLVKALARIHNDPKPNYQPSVLFSICRLHYWQRNETFGMQEWLSDLWVNE